MFSGCLVICLFKINFQINYIGIIIINNKLTSSGIDPTVSRSQQGQTSERVFHQ